MNGSNPNAYQEFFNWLIEAFQGLSDFFNWLVTPISPEFDLAPLALFGIVGFGVVVVLHVIHLVLF